MGWKTALRCRECEELISSEQFSKKVLHGDSYYSFTCAGCSSSGKEEFTRHQLNWISLIQLVLFHLYTEQVGSPPQSPASVPVYFHWKDDICRLIDNHWDDLIPHKKKTPSWTHSVSSALSANDAIFVSGLTAKRASGWWALARWSPPSTSHPTFNAAQGQAEQEPQEAKSEDTASADPKEPIQPSAELKRELLQRLLLVDSGLLESAIRRAKDRKKQERETQKEAKIQRQLELKHQQQEARQQALQEQKLQRKMEREQERLHAKLLQRQEQERKQLEKKAKLSTPESAFDVDVNIVDSEGEGDAFSLLDFSFLKRYAAQAAVPPQSQGAIIRASPYENELLKKCSCVFPPIPPAIARLQRRLLNRKLKRKQGLPLLDLDVAIYAYLKASDQLALRIESTSNDDEHASDDEKSAVAELPQPSQAPINFDLQEVPYIKDPSKSLYAKLTGLRAVYGQLPYPITSPLTGRLLPIFLFRDWESKPLKLRLLEELRERIRPLRVDSGSDSDSDSDNDSDSANDAEDTAEGASSSSIDYVHVRSEHIGQINDMLSVAFWPGINMADALEYPDYSVVALYRQSVIGCGFLAPEGYLSYFHTRPDWQGCGLGRRLLSLLLSTLSPLKDITLHVSADNPAMLLYQQFGFKPEEFAVGFYERYMPADWDPSASRNAFLMRLRRT